MGKTFELWKERRLSRMREGQAVYEVCELLSDPEIRVALVPLTDADYQNALSVAASKFELPDTDHGMLAKDRIMQNGVLLAACREVDDITQKAFASYDEIAQLSKADIDFLFDRYQEMVAFSSPSADGLTQDEVDELKKVLQEMDWNELSGPAWYALRRFLLTASVTQRQVRLPGSSSTSNSTTKRSENEPMSSVELNLTERSARSVTSP